MILINIFSALFIFLLGFLLKKFKLDFLIAGYNTSSKEEREKYDKDKLVNAVGSMLMTSSVFLVVPLLLPLFFQVSEDFILILSWSMFTGFLLAFVVYINTNDSLVKKNKK